MNMYSFIDEGTIEVFTKLVHLFLVCPCLQDYSKSISNDVTTVTFMMTL